jgi:hypothetical protein
VIEVIQVIERSRRSSDRIAARGAVGGRAAFTDEAPTVA